LEGVTSVFPQPSGDDYIICICGSKYNEKNFWSGRWRSVWKVTFDGKKVKVSGSVKVNVHYYERGNIQLNTTKEYAETVDAKSEEEAIPAVAKVLAKVETTFMKEIDSTCNNLSETFKSLRRRLPMTKQLFNFASNEHKLATNFK
jgi:capping protein (actin filament) muscle Z-line, alpha